jgi:hypothetical protein
MFLEAYDDPSATGVWLWTGDHNSDDDYGRWVEAITEAEARFRERSFVVVMVVDPGNPVAPPAVRRRVAEASTKHWSNAAFVLVSESRVVRGAFTAINWLRKPTFEHHVCATFERALEWVQRERGVERLPLERLLQAARDRVV